MEIKQSLSNALKLADLDMNRIQYIVEEEFNGSMEAYLDHVRQLSTDFESALALIVLSYKPEQIAAFASLNLKKIDISIRHIKLFDELCSKNQIQIDNDFINTEIINGFFRPINNAHLSQLVYIERLLKNVLEGINGKLEEATIQPEAKIEVDISDKEQVSVKNDLLSNYSELLSMKDMKSIFKVERNTIYTYEKEGYFKRCSALNKTVMFNKEDVKRYFLSRN